MYIDKNKKKLNVNEIKLRNVYLNTWSDGLGFSSEL